MLGCFRAASNQADETAFVLLRRAAAERKELSTAAICSLASFHALGRWMGEMRLSFCCHENSPAFALSWWARGSPTKSSETVVRLFTEPFKGLGPGCFPVLHTVREVSKSFRRCKLWLMGGDESPASTPGFLLPELHWHNPDRWQGPGFWCVCDSRVAFSHPCDGAVRFLAHKDMG